MEGDGWCVFKWRVRERTDFFYGASKLMHVTAHPLVFVQHVRVKSLSTENEALKKSVS